MIWIMILTLVLLNQDLTFFGKTVDPQIIIRLLRPAGLKRSHLIRIHTVLFSTCKYMLAG